MDNYRIFKSLIEVIWAEYYTMMIHDKIQYDTNIKYTYSNT